MIRKQQMQRSFDSLLPAFLVLVLPAAQAAPCVDKDPSAPVPPIAFREVARGLKHPTDVAHAGDGSRRLFVVEQAGTIRIVEDGKVLKEPFLDIRRKVDAGGEKGLLGLAFHPRFKENGWFYVNYTAATDKLYTVVARFRTAGRHRADPKSETVLLKIHQPYSNHNGGQLTFGPDGYLYIGLGDGGWRDDPHGHGQNLKSLLGKLLRIDVNREEPPRRYAIPKDNPFVGRPSAYPEIWAYGLRNPWRFSFDALTGRLYLADVGQDAAEEIDVIEKGGNYGWNIMEGDICTPGVNPDCDRSGLKPPVHVYRHPLGKSITGGFVYRGRALPGLCGVYLYADYVTRRVWGLRYDGAKVTVNTELASPTLSDKILGKLGASELPAISSFGEDEDRELYAADHQGGKILRIVAP
jgi:glucose/arabinose dehydrogenase